MCGLDYEVAAEAGRRGGWGMGSVLNRKVQSKLAEKMASRTELVIEDVEEIVSIKEFF